MLIMIKSAPDTPDGEHAIRLARDVSADVALIQNGVYFALTERLAGLPGIIHVLDEDAAMRGIDENLDSNARKISYGDLVDLMTEADKAVGLF